MFTRRARVASASSILALTLAVTIHFYQSEAQIIHEGQRDVCNTQLGGAAEIPIVEGDADYRKALSVASLANEKWSSFRTRYSQICIVENAGVLNATHIMQYACKQDIANGAEQIKVSVYNFCMDEVTNRVIFGETIVASFVVPGEGDPEIKGMFAKEAACNAMNKLDFSCFLGHYNFECTISDVDWEDDQKASAKIQCLLEDILTNANYAAECAGQVWDKNNLFMMPCDGFDAWPEDLNRDGVVQTMNRWENLLREPEDFELGSLTTPPPNLLQPGINQSTNEDSCTIFSATAFKCPIDSLLVNCEAIKLSIQDDVIDMSTKCSILENGQVTQISICNAKANAARRDSFEIDLDDCNYHAMSVLDSQRPRLDFVMDNWIRLPRAADFYNEAPEVYQSTERYSSKQVSGAHAEVMALARRHP